MALSGFRKFVRFGLLAPILATACHASDDFQAKPSATDRDDRRIEIAAESSSSRDAPPMDNGIRVVATATALSVQDYLNSREPPGRRFDLPSISFSGDAAIVDPPGAISTLAILLWSNPATRIRVEVFCARDYTSMQSGAAKAAQLRDLFISRGFPANRITSAAIAGPTIEKPRPSVVILSK
jgi:hypothetical protein